MRKFSIAALAVVAVLTVASVADAQPQRQKVNFGQAVARGAGFALGQRLVGGIGGGGFFGGSRAPFGFRQQLGFYGNFHSGAALRQPLGFGSGFYGNQFRQQAFFQGHAANFYGQQAFLQQAVYAAPLIVPQPVLLPEPICAPQLGQAFSACGSLGFGASYGALGFGVGSCGQGAAFRAGAPLRFQFRR